MGLLSTGIQDVTQALADGGLVKHFVIAPLSARENWAWEKLRQRKLLGMPVLTDFSEDAELWRGKIYDPKSGKTYRSEVSLNSANSLKMKGCVAFLCQGQNWTRAK